MKALMLVVAEVSVTPKTNHAGAEYTAHSVLDGLRESSAGDVLTQLGIVLYRARPEQIPAFQAEVLAARKLGIDPAFVPTVLSDE